MKKVLSLVLATVLALSVASVAFANTNVVNNHANRVGLGISGGGFYFELKFKEILLMFAIMLLKLEVVATGIFSGFRLMLDTEPVYLMAPLLPHG